MPTRTKETPLLSADDRLRRFEASVARIAKVQGNIEQVSQQLLAVYHEVGDVLTMLHAGTLIKDGEVPAGVDNMVKYKSLASCRY